MTVAVRLSGPSFQRTFSSGGVSQTASDIDRVFVADRALDKEDTKIGELTIHADVPPSQNAINASRYYLRTIFERAVKLGSWSSPHITLSENGEVVFEWWQHNKKITLYFGESEPEFIKVWGTDIETEMDSGPLTDGWTLTSVWLWLHS
jgi:hypothetical protein